MSQRISPSIGAAVCAASLLLAAPAAAQMVHVPTNDWRQTDRHDAILNASTAPNFFIEMRFGGYLPDIDSEFPKLSPGPFQAVFGFNCPSTTTMAGTQGSVSPAFLFGLEFDYMPKALRIPYVGAIGPGVGWSYTHFSNSAQLVAKPGFCSQESTSLMIMPMHGSMVLRADELMRRTGVPFVPYGKIGAGVAFWQASNDLGTEQLCGQKSDPSMCSGGTQPFATGTGLTPSLHFAIGGMLALNWLEPRASARLDEQTGVHHAYLIGEYYNDKTTIASNVMRVGTSSWIVGLAADF
jgi:hypothetical protein